ncbi:MAG: ion transporter, partial [Prosthecobacter sp.]|nr:ion transporter [Prosthecobacter sp.]
MTSSQTSDQAEQLGTFQVVTLILSVYVLIALFMQSVFHLQEETVALLDRVDFYVCLVFLTDFCIRLHRSPSKLGFMKWGWIDLISSIPMFDALRIGRMVRLIRIFRILRA